MFKLHDKIVASPEEISSGAAEIPNRAEVIYIHPEGRFYTLEFQYSTGSIRETRYFTAGELEAAYREGTLGHRAEHPTGEAPNHTTGALDEELEALMAEMGA